MTARKMSALIGTHIFLEPLPGLRVRCRIANVKHAYGRNRFETESVTGRRKAWVNTESVSPCYPDVPVAILPAGRDAVISNPALYAVVPTRKAVPEPAKRKRTVTEIDFARSAEFRAKKAVDQADSILTRLESRAAAFGKQIAQLQKGKAAVARAARLEDAVLTLMLGAGLDKCDGFHASFAARNAPAALDVLDETLIPHEYFREKTVTSVDKNAVKDALAKGIEVAGVRLTSKVSLVRR